MIFGFFVVNCFANNSILFCFCFVFYIFSLKGGVLPLFLCLKSWCAKSPGESPLWAYTRLFLYTENHPPLFRMNIN